MKQLNDSYLSACTKRNLGIVFRRNNEVENNMVSTEKSASGWNSNISSNSSASSILEIVAVAAVVVSKLLAAKMVLEVSEVVVGVVTLVVEVG